MPGDAGNSFRVRHHSILRFRKCPHPTAPRCPAVVLAPDERTRDAPTDGKRWRACIRFDTPLPCNVEGWYRQGADINTLLQHLSYTSGMSGLRITYWYLTATPELLGAAAERFEAYALPGGEL